MNTMRGALQEMEPLQRQDGSWHEIAHLPLTEPKVSSINASLPTLDGYEGGWVARHKDHEAAEYVMGWNLDDDTRPYGEQPEDGTWETDSDVGYITSCCGQDRPEYKAGLKVEVKPAAGKEFVTMHDYVSVVRLRMTSLREDII